MNVSFSRQVGADSKAFKFEIQFTFGGEDFGRGAADSELLGKLFDPCLCPSDDPEKAAAIVAEFVHSAVAAEKAEKAAKAEAEKKAAADAALINSVKNSA